MGVLQRFIFATGLTMCVLPNVGHAGSIEGKWFLHPFGEMRAYFSDFLAVCDQQEFRRCRIVQYGFGAEDELGNEPQSPQSSFFGTSRLTIQQNFAANGDLTYNFDIFSTKLLDIVKGPIVLSIDGEVFQLKQDEWQSGSPEGYNVAQTFSIIDPELSARLVDAMREGNRLRVLHDGWTETRFQLRGISRALDAIAERDF